MSFLHRLVQAAIAFARAGRFQIRQSVLGSNQPDGNARRRCRRRAAMFPVMTMNENRSLQISNGPRRFPCSLFLYAVVTVGQMDVTNAILLCQLDIRLGTIDADNGPHPPIPSTPVSRPHPANRRRSPSRASGRRCAAARRQCAPADVLEPQASETRYVVAGTQPISGEWLRPAPNNPPAIKSTQATRTLS